MAEEKTCNTCMLLDTCKRVEPKHLGTDYYCAYWASAGERQLEARKEVLDAFGSTVLRFEIPYVKAQQKIKRQRRRKKNV